MNCTRILGLGSPFGDDRAGWAVAQILAGWHWQSRVAIECLDRPGVGLLERFGKSDCVIVIDAVRSGALPGSVLRIEPAGIAAGAAECSSHAFGVAGAVALARALDALPARLAVFGIEAARLDGAEFSPEVEAAIPLLAAEVVRYVETLAPSAETAASQAALRN
jgi:hydrogenase maturation protease